MMFESVSEQMTKQSFIIVVTWTLILFALFVWSLFFPGLIWGYLLAWLTGLIWFAITYQQTQKTIIRNNKEWKRTFDAVPDLLAILDNHQRILQCNKAMAETFGCSCSKMIGTKCYQIFHETDMPPSYCPFIPMLMDGKEHTKEIHLDKNNKDFLITTSPIYDEHGELDGCIHVARDITEHKQYETILHKFDFIVNSSEDFITLINKDYVYEAVSRSYHNVLNMNKNDIIGKRVVDVWGQDIFEKYIKEHLERCFAGNESISEGWFKFHTKGRGYYEVRYFPYFNENGEVTHVAVFSIDLTDRKQLEEAREEREELYRAMFEGNQAVKLLIDPSTGNIIDANPAASKFYGYPLDTLKTMKIFEINILSPDQIKKKYDGSEK